MLNSADNNADAMTDRNVVRNFYYKDTKKLNTRMDIWKQYGTNEISFFDWIINSLEIEEQNGSVIDVGCGTGDLLVLLKKKYPDLSIFGMDISESMIEVSKNKNEGSCKNFQVGDITEIPFSNNYFDYVLSVHVLHHVDDVVRAINELIRVLKPKGILYLVTGNYQLDAGLNRYHYESLAELDFPGFMHEKEQYLRFDDRNAIQFFDKMGLTYKRYVYRNDLVFHEARPAMDYYSSAMMYRRSKGESDHRISSEQWQSLYENMQKKIGTDIEKNGIFVHPGEVVGYKIIK